MEAEYQQAYDQFRWDIPPRFNMAQGCLAHPRDQVAVVAAGAPPVTYGALDDLSARLANVFRARGISPGDRVAILLSQSWELAVSHLAAYRMGAIAVPLFSLFGPDALLYRINDCEAKVIVTDAGHQDMVADLVGQLPSVPSLQSVLVTGAPVHPGLTSFDTCLLSADSASSFHDTSSEDPAVIIYTSGTTGAPKGALHAHRVLLGHLPGVSLSHNLLPQAGDRIWTPADWAWIGGLYDVLFPALYWGVPVLAHRMDKFDPEEAFNLLAREAVRNTFLPPTALKIMRRVPDPQNRYDLHLRSVASGGESLGEETLDWGRSTFGLTINEFYGQTECNMVLSNCAALGQNTPWSAGVAVFGHTVAIVTDQGDPLPPGDIGTIAVKRPDPVMFLGYWKNATATAEKFHHDWLMTGDLGYQDESGRIFFVSRADDLISSGGYRIGPGEIEDSLLKHPAVLMAAVIGKKDPVRGEIVKAYVVLRDPARAGNALRGELQEWVKTRLAYHEYPREVEFVDALPLTASGKVRRNVLRERSGRT